MCWIKQCIKRASISKSNAIRLPITQKEVQNRIKSFENIYFIKNGQYPTTLETSISLGIKEEEINLIKKYDTEIISLNAPIGEEDLTFEDCIKDDIDIEEIVENIEMLKKLRKFIQEKLTKREKEVLNLRVYKDYTLSQIGERLKISTENVRRVEIKYKKKIKKYFDENQLL